MTENKKHRRRRSGKPDTKADKKQTHVDSSKEQKTNAPATISVQQLLNAKPIKAPEAKPEPKSDGSEQDAKVAKEKIDPLYKLPFAERMKIISSTIDKEVDGYDRKARSAMVTYYRNKNAQYIKFNTGQGYYMSMRERAIINAVVESQNPKNKKALDMIRYLDECELGKESSKLELSGPDGKPLQSMNMQLNGEYLDKLTDKELEDLIELGEKIMTFGPKSEE